MGTVVISSAMSLSSSASVWRMLARRLFAGPYYNLFPLASIARLSLRLVLSASLYGSSTSPFESKSRMPLLMVGLSKLR